MNLQELVRSLRPEKPREFDESKPIAMWTEKDTVNGEITDAFVLILRTRGCYWALNSGCTMCGYINDARMEPVSDENMAIQLEKALKKYRGERVVKIFTSGSFLDPNEISPGMQVKIARAFGDADRFIVESLPEFVVGNILEPVKQENLEIAIGLESASDDVLEKNVNKSFRVKDYVRAAELMKEMGIALKTYLLLKPPFMTEKEAIEDAKKSVLFAAKYSDEISLNPINIQSHTLVNRLWKRGEYRPPWLWSVMDVIKATKPEIGDVRLVSWPTAGGLQRGAHNCGKCDKQVLGAIERFSLTQDLSVFEGLSCSCHGEWENILEMDDALGFEWKIL